MKLAAAFEGVVLLVFGAELEWVGQWVGVGPAVLVMRRLLVVKVEGIVVLTFLRPSHQAVSRRRAVQETVATD